MIAKHIFLLAARFAVEQLPVVVQRLLRQSHNLRPGRQRGAWLVEPPMAVSADAQELQVDPASLPDRVLVLGAECFRILGQPVWHMGLLKRDFYPLEQLLPHKTRIALILRIRLG